MQTSLAAYRDKGVTDFQIEGGLFLAHGVAESSPAYRRTLLLDEMRVGKTPAAIVGADILGCENILWLTLGSARKGHAEDWAKFSQMDRDINVLLSGKDRVAPRGINITSWDLAAGSLHQKLSAQKYDLVVADEIDKCKSVDANRSKALFGEDFTGGGFSDLAEYCWGLTGTLMPNHPNELWPVLRAWFPRTILVDGKPLTYDKFEKRFCKFYVMNPENPYRRRRVITGGKNIDELRERVRPIFLRRKFTEVAPDVPLPTMEDIYVEPKLPREIQDGDSAFLSQVEKAAKTSSDPLEIVEQLSKDERARLRRLLGLTKVSGVAKLVDAELKAAPGKIVIFAYHREVIEFLLGRLKQHGAVALYGGMTPKKKFEVQDAFANDNACRAIIGQYKSAGAGINLSAADEWLAAEPDYSTGDVEQALKRVMNIFKMRQVRMRFALAEGSMDTGIMRKYRSKLEVTQQVFG